MAVKVYGRGTVEGVVGADGIQLSKELWQLIRSA
jgi:hypothetical protein